MGLIFDKLIFPLLGLNFPQNRSQYQTFGYNQHTVYYFCKEMPSAQLSIIYFHGNGQLASQSFKMVQKIVQQTKSNLYIIQYPNYGIYKTQISQPIQDRIKADAKQFFNHLIKTKNLELQKLTIIGRSIGSGPAAYLASEIKAPRLVLISPITTIKQVVSSFLWFLPIFNSLISLTFKKYFDNIESLKKFNGSLLIIHGQKDQIVPINLGKQLVQLYIGRNPRLCNFRYPKHMTHNQFNHEQDIVRPIAYFINQQHQKKQMDDLC